MIIFNELTYKMSAEKYISYAEAFRKFRTNVAENDFHDDYPETAEMTLAITSGLRYHYLYNYRTLTVDRTVRLIDTFAKRCVKLDNYKDAIDNFEYRPKQMVMHERFCGDLKLGYAEWFLLCYSVGLINLSYERKNDIELKFIHANTWAMRNPIQLKLLDRDIKRRIEIQQKLKRDGKLVNDISGFNHIFKYHIDRSINMKTGKVGYVWTIDQYYDGSVNERLGTDTIYEWILNDDLERFQQWYNGGGLCCYSNVPSRQDKTTNYRESIAAHILSSNPVKIIRFIIMNNIQEFLDEVHGMRALMDPWRYPVNDPEIFRLLQEHFRPLHEQTVRIYIENDTRYTDVLPGHVYRFVKPEIAMAIHNEVVDLFNHITGKPNICFQLYNAVMISKYGHIEPIESIDWTELSEQLSTLHGYHYNNSFSPQDWISIFLSRESLLSSRFWKVPFGMNPSTAVYLHDLFSENNVVRMQLDRQLIDYIKYNWHPYDLRSDNRITMPEFEEEEDICTDDELYW